MRYKKRQAAKQTLATISDYPANYLVIHYSCESFYDIKDGRTPRITSIAVREYYSGQTHSFSIHKIAEKSRITESEIEKCYDKLEKEMLDEFFCFVEKNEGKYWIHWNMRNINYGFDALYHRYEVLKGSPKTIDQSHLIDGARLMKDYYGEGYAGGHPRLENVLKLNKMMHPDFLTGSEEAGAFDNHEYIKLHQSTLRKVNCISALIEMSSDRRLKVKSSWYEIYGTTPQSIYEMLRDKWWFAIATFLLGIVIGRVIGI